MNPQACSLISLMVVQTTNEDFKGLEKTAKKMAALANKLRKKENV